MKPKPLSAALASVIGYSHVVGQLPVHGSLQFYYDHGLLQVTSEIFPPRRD